MTQLKDTINIHKITIQDFNLYQKSINEKIAISTIDERE